MKFLTDAEKLVYSILLLRGGAVAARRAHNPKVIGSNPVPATRKQKAPNWVLFCFKLGAGGMGLSTKPTNDLCKAVLVSRLQPPLLIATSFMNNY